MPEKNKRKEFITFYHIKNDFLKKDANWNKFAIFVSIFVFVFIIPVFVFNLVFFRAQVIGPSMKPTFNINLEEDMDEQFYINSKYKDIVVVNRFDKGSCGDIVLFNFEGETLIKRIIARQGQKITLKQNGTTGIYSYYIDDQKINEGYLGEKSLTMDIEYFKLFCNTFKLTMNYYEASIVVPQGKVFVLGDNRAKSKDSHVFGFIDNEVIKGKVEFYYSYDQNLLTYIFNQIGKSLGIA